MPASRDHAPSPGDGGDDRGDSAGGGGRADTPASPDDGVDAFSPSFRLTMAFLTRYPRYRETLALTPEHYRFDRVLWNSSLATLRQLLASVAESGSLAVSAPDVDEAVRNLVEGIVLRGQAWKG